MLSKEEKLKYGEALRQQMKEKEEKKRNDDLAKRAVNNVLKSQSDRVLVPDPAIFDQKDALIKKLQTQDYNPFGKAGGGAPNRRQANHPNNEFEQNRSVLQGYSSQEHLPNRNYPPETYNVPAQSYGSYDLRNIPQMPTYNRNEPPPQQGLYSGSQQALGYQNSGSDYPLKPTINKYQQNETDPRAVPQLRSYPEPPENIPPQLYQRSYQEYPQKPYPERVQRQPPVQYIEPQGRSGLYRQDYSQPQLNNERTLAVQMQPQAGRSRIKTLQNEDIQQVYKKGGRNLLRLQNETVDEHLVKQKQKLQMQAFLRQQMEQAQRRKQEERQTLKREEIQEERRNKEYIERQNQKLKDDQRKKVEDKQKLAEENLKSLAIKKQLQQEVKIKGEKESMERRMREDLEVRKQREIQNPREKGRNYEHEERDKRPREDSSSSISQTSSEQNTHSKGFNTNISRDFVKKEREKQVQRGRNDKKLQLFTNEIQRMRDQIMGQGEMFQKEIEKIKKEAERAQDQKRRADLEVQRLKLQLQKKNKESELRLLDALKRNNPYNQNMPPQRPEREPEPYQKYPQNSYDSLNELEENEYLDRRPYGIPSQHPPSPKKPMSKAKKRVYDHPQEHIERPPLSKPSKKEYNWQKDFQLQQSNIGTLEADSKKIPLNIQNGAKLTISGVENYGKDAFLYGQSETKPRRFEQMKPGSRESGRAERDELDKFVQNKWQLSTVKDDITQQIQQLLKKKDNSGELQPSKISRAGREILSRGAIPYDGPALGTINSYKVSLVSDNGTLDIDRIHGRNEARLRQLKALGVETVNTNNDEDLNRLNALLNNYR